VAGTGISPEAIQNDSSSTLLRQSCWRVCGVPAHNIVDARCGTPGNFRKMNQNELFWLSLAEN
jgi:hypothetical protein